MANYTGVHCPVCNKRFVEDDDVVVCPICGAPHHRACYQQLGHCALGDLHIKGHTWQPPQEERQAPGGPQEGAGAVCPSCGAANPPTGLFCQVCGAPLHRAPQEPPRQQGQPFSRYAGQPYQAAPAQNAYNAAFGGLNPSEDLGGASARDLALYVGENSGYFLPRFKQISEGKHISFNFCALFFNFFYFFYRKMYAVGLLLLGILLLSQIPTLIVLPEIAQLVLSHVEEIYAGTLNMVDLMNGFQPAHALWAYAAMGWVRYLLLAAGVLFACYANRFYFRHAVKKVTAIRESFCSSPEGFDDRRYTAALTHAGRTNRALVIVAAVGCVVAYFAVYIGVVMMVMMR